MAASASPPKSIAIAYVLWIFAGGLGAHKFYLRRPGLGALYVCLLVLFWIGAIGAGMNAVSLITQPGHHPSGGSAMMILMMPLSLALLYDLFTIPLQVRAANGGFGASASGSKWTRAYEDKGLDGAQLAKVDETIARFKAQQTAPKPATPQPSSAPRALATAGGTPTFGKRR
jgi:TM2 domain-containing membrane protein YozV